MKNFLVLLLFSMLFLTCGTQKQSGTQKIVDYKYDTIYQNSFKELPNTKALVGKYNIASNYFPATGYNHRVKYIILHYTAMDDEGSARALTQKEVSSHYLIQTYNDKNIQLLVPEFERAWHAGISYWRGKENLNDTSIGIEIVNPGYTGDKEHMVFYDFTPEQMEKVVALLKDLIARYEIEPYNVIGHSDVAPDRKQDPGPKFPWKELYKKYNIGAWYNDSDVYYYKNQYPDSLTAQSYSFISSWQNDLNRYGYQITPTGVNDKATKKVVQAFQFHFRPEDYSGEMDKETWAILKSLLMKYPPK